MRSELKSARSEAGKFLSSLKGRRGLWLAGALILVGLILVFAGGSSGKQDSASLGEEEKIEARLEELCSSLEGVGACKVMVSCYTVGKSYGSAGELRVESVVILCRGGGSERVRKELTELVVSLYGIGSNRVKIGVLGKK